MQSDSTYSPLEVEGPPRAGLLDADWSLDTPTRPAPKPAAGVNRALLVCAAGFAALAALAAFSGSVMVAAPAGVFAFMAGVVSVEGRWLP